MLLLVGHRVCVFVCVCQNETVEHSLILVFHTAVTVPLPEHTMVKSPESVAGIIPGCALSSLLVVCADQSYRLVYKWFVDVVAASDIVGHGKTQMCVKM